MSRLAHSLSTTLTTRSSLAFYEEFLSLLHEELKGEVSIFGHPMLGHTPGFTCSALLTHKNQF